MVDFAHVDALAAGYHRRGGQPGLAYGIVAGSELVHAAGLGERHLDVVMARLKRHYGVSGDLKKPQIAYRETILGKGEGQGRHGKGTGGDEREMRPA